MEEDNWGYEFTDEMIEGLVEESLDNDLKEHQKLCDEIMAIQGIEPIEAEMEEVWHCPDGYIFKDENGNVINATKIVLEKKKEYPKTYEECCRLLDIDSSCLLASYDIGLWKDELFSSLQKLYICRNAYWEIAGEEMGLGKPWKPNWDAKDNHFYTIYTFNGKIECSATAHRNAVIIFPTKEMRDAFYENFKELIESVKELL